MSMPRNHWKKGVEDKDMDPLEVVRRTLDFDNPPRVARSFPPSDMVCASVIVPNPKGDWVQIADRSWERTDEWGNLWVRIDKTSKGQVKRGVLDNLDLWASITLPDFSNPMYYQEAKVKFEANAHLWKIGCIHGLTFSIVRKMRKLEQYLMDIILEREKLSVLHNRIDRLIMDQIDNFARIGANSIMFAEDWGTQDRLLINPILWREEFKPRYKKLCSYAHNCGLRVFMHSCGKITDIIPDLIEAGVDLLQFDQPSLHGIDTLRQMQLLGKITFWCPVDIQKTLQTRNEDLIRAEARELIDKLWRGRGGFVAGYYEDEKSIGLDSKWQQIACDEFKKRGVAGQKFVGRFPLSSPLMLMMGTNLLF